MTRMKTLSVAIFCLVSCNNGENSKDLYSNKLQPERSVTVKESKSDPNKYFNTQNINIKKEGRTKYFYVHNSLLLQAMKDKLGIKWDGPESWVSVAAMNDAKLEGSDIDSLIYKVDVNNEPSVYKYSIKELRNANRHFLTCKKFFTFLNSNKVDDVYMVLSADIRDKYSKAEILNFIKSTFERELINSVELIGLKVVDKKYSLYVNLIYASGLVRTYAFSFIKSDEAIAGMQIVGNG